MTQRSPTTVSWAELAVNPSSRTFASAKPPVGRGETTASCPEEADTAYTVPSTDTATVAPAPMVATGGGGAGELVEGGDTGGGVDALDAEFAGGGVDRRDGAAAHVDGARAHHPADPGLASARPGRPTTPAGCRCGR
ncbi:MAG: hypothetical protein IPN45_10575 [Actinomycetales bacterium]|nr:hypothetical protein [Actinomycetales bacterium]